MVGSCFPPFSRGSIGGLPLYPCTSATVALSGGQDLPGCKLARVSAEDAEARAEALSYADGKTPMALEAPRKPRKLSPEEKLARAEARKAEQAEARRERERLKAEARAQARLDKIAAAEGPKVDLPAVVLRDKRVLHVSLADVPALLRPFLGDMCLDVEHSGYDLGHRLYELRTIQLGGYPLAVVLDASDPMQAAIASWALRSARKLRSHSSTADNIPCIVAGLISWDEAWDKTYDSVLTAKLTDPALSKSDANALKQLAKDMLGDDAVAPEAEKAKNALFKAMGCLTKTTALTPPEQNGWYMVDKRAEVMIRYAGSDVLDLAAVVMKLDPLLPVGQDVLDRERMFQKACARVSMDGFALDEAHIDAKLAEHEEHQAQMQVMVSLMSGGLITNPSSSDTGAKLLEIDPALAGLLEVSDKTGEPSAAKKSLMKIKKGDKHFPLAEAILGYRHDVTTLGLLLRPLKKRCSEGDSRMRPTVLTINASTGRTSCVRENGQQFSRQGGVRKCVCADCGFLGISADFQGCEIKVAAGLSGDANLLEAEVVPRCYYCGDNPCSCERFHTGLHWMAAHEAFGKEATYEHRYWCKRGIFCKLFGGGPDTAASQVYCDVDPMRRVFSAFEALAPTYTAWDRWLRQCYYDGSMVWRDFETGTNYSTPIDGRRRMVYQAYSGRNIYVSNGAHAAGNGAIQGTARELLVDAVLKWSQTRWGRYALLVIHDEILTWVPADEAEEASATLKQCMETSVLSSPGFPVLIGADTDKPFAYWPDSS